MAHFTKTCRSASLAAAIPRRKNQLFLTRFASKVYLIHRRDKMRASKIMQERVFANKKIEPIWNTVVTQYIRRRKGRDARGAFAQCEDKRGTRAGGGVRFRRDRARSQHEGVSRQTRDRSRRLSDRAETRSKAKHPGVFIAGDVADRIYKQAITAAGIGLRRRDCRRRSI